jgi:hypothetical protein
MLPLLDKTSSIAGDKEALSEIYSMVRELKSIQATYYVSGNYCEIFILREYQMSNVP